jgi:P27 family predicted phage terminase small subunit
MAKQHQERGPSRTRTPTPLLKLRGSKLAAAREATEPKYDADLPQPPLHLSDDAQTEWDAIVPQLERAGVLRNVDRTALIAYVTCYAIFMEASEGLLVGGKLVVEDAKGDESANPRTAIMFSALKELHHWLAEFGMTPASRSFVKVERPADEGELKPEDFVKFGGAAAND